MKAIVFDMDGVLFDTERLCKDSWVAVAQEQGIPDMEEVFPKCIGCNNTDTTRIILEHYGQDFPYREFADRASQWFWREIREKGLPQKKGVRELLDYLKQEGYLIGLASSTRRASVLAHLERAGISEYFDGIVGGDQLLHSKPEPDIYLMACRELGVEPGEAVAIEDSYNGIRAAHRAGMKSIMVPDMLPATEEMEELSDAILADLTKVIGFLQVNR